MRGVPGGEQGLRTHLDGRQVDHEGRHVDEEGFHLGVTGQRISGTARASLHAPRRAQVDRRSSVFDMCMRMGKDIEGRQYQQGSRIVSPRIPRCMMYCKCFTGYIDLLVQLLT